MIAPSPLNIQRRLTELGRIRLGEKGSKGEPRKLNKFRLTSASRPLLEGVARVYGGTVRAWPGAPDEGYWELYTDSDALDIMVPPTMNAYSQLYEDWAGGTCSFRCDGTYDFIAQAPCDHDPEHEGRKVTTRVSVILPKVPGLGVWRVETKGWNAATTMPAALDMLLAVGQQGWVPATLRLEHDSKRERLPNGRVMTHRFVVPVIDLLGVTFGELLAAQQVDRTPIETQAQSPRLGPGQIGHTRPPHGTKVDRPELGPAPELPAVSTFRKPVDAPAPIAPPTIAGWVVEDGDATGTELDAGTDAADAAPAASQGESDGPADLTAKLRDLAARSGLEGAPTRPQRERLQAAFGSLEGPVIQASLIAVFGHDRLATAAEAQACITVADSLGDEPFGAAWARLAS